MAEPTSLYRRYRPQRFAEVRGQDFVVHALRNAVRDGSAAHAYLFSGPRGTGKTTSARLLAKALNCTDRGADGDCCDACHSCVAVREGASLDVIELDAASNRRIDNIRDLLSTIPFSSPGERKVYIIDEVHQLTNEAETALLKTLEEPPDHVLFVLATTDPQKVSGTIRSRTQHFEFRLFGADELGTLVHEVAEKAGITLDERSIETVVRDGRGSARDALSVLEQVAAAGGIRDEVQVTEGLVEALASRDAGAVLVAVAEGLRSGRDPRRLGVELIERLRWCFLSLLAPELVDCLDDERAAIAEQAKRLGPAATTRAIEVIGEALVDQRESVDPRVTLEVALVRLTRPELDTSPSALAERLERLERGTPAAAPAVAPLPAPAQPRRTEPTPAAQAAAAAQAGRPPMPVAEAADPAAEAGAVNGPAAVRAALGAIRGTARSAPGAAPAPPARSAPTPDPGAPAPANAAPGSANVAPASANAAPGSTNVAPVPAHAAPGSANAAPGSANVAPVPANAAPGSPAAAKASAMPAADTPAPPVPAAASPHLPAPGPAPAGGGFPTRAELTKAWGDTVLPSLKPGPKSRFGSGRFVTVEGETAVFGVENEPMRQACDSRRAEVEAALAAYFGRPVPLRIVVDDAPGQAGGPGITPAQASAEEDVDLSALTDAPTVATSDPTSLVLEAFPGTEELSTDD